MPERSELANLIFGRLSWEAIPYHEPILLATFAVVAIGGLAVVGLLTYYRVWGYLWREWFTSIDHKKIGIMYIVLGIVMLLRGFADAIMMRMQQAVAFGDSTGFLPPHHYDQIFTAHGVIMIFFVAMPLVTGLMNFVMPLQIGARDVAFPFLNNFSFWMTTRIRAHRLAGVSAAVGHPGEPRRRGRLLHLGIAGGRGRHRAIGHQPAGDHRQDARAGHDADAHADLHVDGAVHQRADRGRLPGADGRAHVAGPGPLCRHQFLHG